VKLLLQIMGCAALGALVWLCCEAALTQRAARPALAGLNQSANLLNAKDGSIAKLNATLSGVDKMVEVGTDAAQKQADFYDPKKPGGATQQIQRILVDAKKLIGRTDINLNGGLDPITKQRVAGGLPSLAAALESTNALASRAALDIDTTSGRMQPILADLGAGATAFAQKTPEILQHVDDSTAQLVITSQNVAGATDDVHATTHDIAAYVHRETTPIRGTLNLIKSFLVTFAGPAAQVATAVK
jgi:hypothetical protein